MSAPIYVYRPPYVNPLAAREPDLPKTDLPALYAAIARREKDLKDPPWSVDREGGSK